MSVTYVIDHIFSATKTPNFSEQQYKKAVANNPDPTRLVPAPAVGFEDLKKRLEEQDKAIIFNTGKLAKLKETLAELEQKHIKTVEQV